MATPVLANALDPYTYKGTSVLINRANLRDPAAARRFESNVTAVRTMTFPEVLRAGPLNLQHFREIHRHLFQDVYAWAGELRTVNISKGGTSFARADLLLTEGNRIFDQLARENYFQGLPKPAFVEKLASFYGDLNALHPFREDNGRATRAVFELIAERAGYQFDYRRVDRDDWNQSASRSVAGDIEGMKKIFTASMRPLRAVAFEKMERHSALARFPELRGAYAMFDAMLRNSTRNLGGNRQAKEVFERQARDTIQLRLDGGFVPNVEALQRSQMLAPGAGAPVVPARGPKR